VREWERETQREGASDKAGRERERETQRGRERDKGMKGETRVAVARLLLKKKKPERGLSHSLEAPLCVTA
jgi:hypothetical protein